MICMYDWSGFNPQTSVSVASHVWALIPLYGTHSTSNKEEGFWRRPHLKGLIEICFASMHFLHRSWVTIQRYRQDVWVVLDPRLILSARWWSESIRLVHVRFRLSIYCILQRYQNSISQSALGFLGCISDNLVGMCRALSFGLGTPFTMAHRSPLACLTMGISLREPSR